jgi:hypothetical protein
MTTNDEFIAGESDDGRTLFLTRRGPDGRSSLFSRPSAGGPGRQIVGCVQGVAVGSDGVYYAGCPFGRRDVPLHRLDTGTLRSRLLGTITSQDKFVRGLALSPDGKTILFAKVVGDDDADLMMIENFR